MKKLLLALLLAGNLNCFAAENEFLTYSLLPQQIRELSNNVKSKVQIPLTAQVTLLNQLAKINTMLHQEPALKDEVIDKTLTALACANQQGIDYSDTLIVIDYTLPANQKRFWEFDLIGLKSLFNTYVSHGLNNGIMFSDHFSNNNNSKAGSLGIYITQQAYRGREGLSLKLDGLDKNFNDNAYHRFIVMHGAWYVDEDFIQKYGRPGRSWGCPAVPLNLSETIINTIENNSLFIVYYPNQQWISKSRFLNCSGYKLVLNHETIPFTRIAETKTATQAILYADLKNTHQRIETDPVLAVSADNYRIFFKNPIPLQRMLRRQINHMEYIVLTSQELKQLAASAVNDGNLAAIKFVIPEVKLTHGYYETYMKILNLGKLKSISNDSNGVIDSFKAYFDSNSTIHIKSTNYFIRWLGL